MASEIRRLRHLRASMGFLPSDPTVTSAAKHVRDAITNPNATNPPPQKGKTKVIPSSWQRWVASVHNVKRANRNPVTDTCQTYEPSLYGQPGWQCDEVPYAASYQSAGLGGDFSARMIPAGENGRAGNAYLGFMVGHRILDAQRFLVTVEQ